MKVRLIFIFLTTTLIAIGLTACAVGTTVAETGSGSNESIDEAVVTESAGESAEVSEVIVATATVTAEAAVNNDDSLEEAESGDAGTEAQVAEAEVPAPTPRAGLASTDPATVSLASGEIQLVEFFAYW